MNTAAYSMSSHSLTCFMNHVDLFEHGLVPVLGSVHSLNRSTNTHKRFALSVCWLSTQTANNICHYLTTNKITRAERERGSIIVTFQERARNVLFFSQTHIHRQSELLRAKKHSSNHNKRIKCQNNLNTNQEKNALKRDNLQLICCFKPTSDSTQMCCLKTFRKKECLVLF